MIVQVSGKVTSVGENSITLEVNELAYEIFVPSSVSGIAAGMVTGCRNSLISSPSTI